jgi:phage terminase Nu1 subunit (DNA packaging protein)
MMRNPEWTWGAGPWTAAQVKRIASWHQGRSREAAAGIGDGAGADADQENAIRALKLNPEKAARVRLIIQRTVGQELENKEKQGKLLDAELVERGRMERVQAVRESLLALVHTLPPKLVGLGAAAMEGVIEGELRGVCNRFANG